MLRCLKAINPTHWCFTATDLEESLIEIESILKEVDDLHKMKQDPIQLHAHKQEVTAVLESAYALALRCLANCSKGNPDKKLTFLIADILRHYGNLCFHENYFFSHQLLSIAMNLQLYSIGLSSSPIDLSSFYSLQDFKDLTKIPTTSIDSVHSSLVTTSLDVIVSTTFSDCLMRNSANHRLFVIANTARLLGLSYKQTQSANEKGLSSSFLKQLFSLSEALLLLIDDFHSREELANLYLSTWPLFRSPNCSASSDSSALYEKTIAHHNTPEMLARVVNKQFLIEFAANQKTSAKNHLEKALELADTLQLETFNPYLLSSIHYNYASFFLEASHFDIEKAEKYLKKVCEFTSHSRQLDEDRLYFAVYDERMAEVQYLLGDFKAAQKYTDIALATLNKYPESNHNLLPKIQALRAVIDKAI